MNSSIITKISLVLLIPFLGSILGLTVFYSILVKIDKNDGFIHVAERQYYLSKQLLVYSNMIHFGQEEGRKELLDCMLIFEQSLHILGNGGQVMGRTVSVPDKEILKIIRILDQHWLQLKPIFGSMANLATNSPESLLALEKIKGQHLFLVDNSALLISTFESWNSGMHKGMLYILLIIASLGLLSLITGAWLMKRYVFGRVQSEKDLRHSEERFAMAIAGSSDGIWAWNLVDNSLFLSPQWKQMLGYSETDINNNFIAWRDLIHFDDLGHFLETWTNYMEGSSDYFSVEYRLRKEDGSYTWVLCRGTITQMNGSTVCRLSGSHKDITEQKDIQQQLIHEKEEQMLLTEKIKIVNEQLLQSDKMASIGQLAAGVAHEINNPVGYINSNIGSLKEYIDDLLRIVDVYEGFESKFSDSNILSTIQKLKQEIDLDYLKRDIMELIVESQEGTTRVKQIVQSLKDFSHVDEVEWQWVDLHKGIDSTLNVVNNEIKYKADVVKEYGELPQVECLISQLNQVFMNILVNACHAMHEKCRGTITIRTGFSSDGVYVEFIDTGGGMSKEVQKRIFEPFYTTKAMGKGTGLGLSLSYNIIQKHDGSISVESEVGLGTKFTIWIPRQHQRHLKVSKAG